MIKSPADDIEKFIPDENGKTNYAEVQTSIGVGKLAINRENEESYFLSFYMPNADKPNWTSNSLPRQALAGVWFMCWIRPFGFLP